jgi:transposase-like protein/IS1 family transposase
MRATDDKACLKPGCENCGTPGVNIVGYGWFTTKLGRRRRYRCKICGGTVSLNTGTAYSGLRCTRREFDQVASLRVEGVSIAATARVTGHSRDTIARWLERASSAAARFNWQMLRDFDVLELQADEICTFIGSRSRPTWLFATIEVASRVWASSLVGRRSARNTTAVLNDVILRGRFAGCPLIATDGFAYYHAAIRRLIGPACVYGHVLKTRRNNRVVRVERRVKIGTATRLKAALWESEDSETLNTSFVERLNLTIRQGSAYLRRRSPCHARCEERLRGHAELLRCHYNFVRPHRALKFGRETRTPAMQAGVVSTRLIWSHIFAARGLSRRFFVAVVRIPVIGQRREPGTAELPTFSWPYEQRTAA